MRQESHKEKANVKEKSPATLVYDPKYKDVICYNCGEPGHYVGLCTKQKCCFICGKAGHHMDDCLEWYKPMPMAQYWGSASPGLGFFHVEVEDPEAAKWMNFDNLGVVTVIEGEVNEQELEQNLSEMWNMSWYWQLRQLASDKYQDRLYILRGPRQMNP